MRSLARNRQLFESVLRIGSLGLIAWMIWLSLAPRDAAAGRRASGSRSLADSLEAWTLDPRAESLDVLLDTVPDRAERAWLSALRRAGPVVSWSSRSLTPLALAVEPLNDPAGGVRALIAAPPGARVWVSDALGLVDSLSMAAPSSELRLRALDGAASASPGGRAASAMEQDSLEPRGVVVLGSAGWEAKFVTAALEESGWDVTARLAVAPAIDVRQRSVRLDTSVTGVVVALDSTAARDARQIEAFVREGGGLVLAGEAARSPAFAGLAAGRVGARVRAAAISFADSAPRRALGFYPIVEPARGAVPLESRDSTLVAAARRVGAGRVVQVGYDETWRWRLQGGEGAPEAHRAWWTAVVGSAGYRSAHKVTGNSSSLDPAPVAATFAALGEPTVLEPPTPVPPARNALHRWMLLLLFATLLAEWASRRLRGVP